jgi:S-adenosylmethionine/arginine decarboxylase-like enzyme
LENLTIDGYNGDKQLLDSKEIVLTALCNLRELLGMNILTKPSVVTVPESGVKDPGGWSGFVIIAESHISIHTFPKRGFFHCFNFIRELLSLFAITVQNKSKDLCIVHLAVMLVLKA